MRENGKRLNKKKKKTSMNLPSLKIILFTVLVFAVGSGLFSITSNWYKNYLQNKQQNQVRIELASLGNSLTTILNERMGLLEGLKAFILFELESNSANNLRQSYDFFAKGLYAGKTDIQGIQVFPPSGTVLNYPQEGNEATQNRTLHNLINDERPQVRADVARTINSRITTISNPYELKQGELGLLFRRAIFQNEILWGIATISFKLPVIMELSGLNPAPKNLIIGLKDINGNIFEGDPAIYSMNPVSYPIVLLNQTWLLSGIPSEGWSTSYMVSLRLFQTIAMIIVLLITALTFILTSQSIRLRHLIDLRTMELQKSEERFKDITLNTSDVVWEIDRQGNYLFCSNKTINLFGYSPTEMLTKNVFDLMPKNQAVVARKAYATCIRRKLPFRNFETWNIRKDGKKFCRLSSGVPIFNQNKKLIGFRGIDTDITKRKEDKILLEKKNNELKDLNRDLMISLESIIGMNNELEIAQKKAEESDNLKSAFLANISHEIRTPMNGILGFSELLKKPNLSKETQTKYINFVQESGKRMLETVSEIIDISKLESGQMQISHSEINLIELIEQVIESFSHEAEGKGIKILFRQHLGKKGNFIITDKDMLYSILSKLVNNAVKYSSEGIIEIDCIRKEKKLEVHVIDSGIGIPPDKLKIIFDRFAQAENIYNRTYQGSGLGLSIVKAYIELLGGTIRVESSPNQGSRFSFNLPIA